MDRLLNAHAVGIVALIDRSTIGAGADYQSILEVVDVGAGGGNRQTSGLAYSGVAVGVVGVGRELVAGVVDLVRHGGHR